MSSDNTEPNFLPIVVIICATVLMSIGGFVGCTVMQNHQRIDAIRAACGSDSPALEVSRQTSCALALHIHRIGAN